MTIKLRGMIAEMKQAGDESKTVYDIPAKKIKKIIVCARKLKSQKAMRHKNC